MSVSGITNIQGSRKPTLKVSDKTYTLSPVGLDQFGEIENFILDRRASPFDIVGRLSSETPEEIREMLVTASVERAMKAGFATTSEINDYDNSLPGIAHRLMLSLRPLHPDVKAVKDALRIIETAGNERLAEIQAKVQEASGDDNLGNSSGREISPADPQTPPKESTG